MCFPAPQPFRLFFKNRFSTFSKIPVAHCVSCAWTRKCTVFLRQSFHVSHKVHLYILERVSARKLDKCSIRNYEVWSLNFLSPPKKTFPPEVGLLRNLSTIYDVAFKVVRSFTSAFNSSGLIRRVRRVEKFLRFSGYQLCGIVRYKYRGYRCKIPHSRIQYPVSKSNDITVTCAHI